MVQLYFKFNLLSARILRIGVGVLVGCALLLQMLILDLDRHEKLDAALVLLLIAGDERWLLARRVDISGGGAGVGRLSRLLLLQLVGSVAVHLLLDCCCCCSIVRVVGVLLGLQFALFIDVG